MITTKDIVNKANDDYIKFKARLLYSGKEDIFNQSEKIQLAKKVKELLTATNVQYDNYISHALIDMDNVYDVFYKVYKKKYKSDTPAFVQLDCLFQSVVFDYKY